MKWIQINSKLTTYDSHQSLVPVAHGNIHRLIYNHRQGLFQSGSHTFWLQSVVIVSDPFLSVTSSSSVATHSSCWLTASAAYCKHEGNIMKTYVRMDIKQCSDPVQVLDTKSVLLFKILRKYAKTKWCICCIAYKLRMKTIISFKSETEWMHITTGIPSESTLNRFAKWPGKFGPIIH